MSHRQPTAERRLTESSNSSVLCDCVFPSPSFKKLKSYFCVLFACHHKRAIVKSFLWENSFMFPVCGGGVGISWQELTTYPSWREASLGRNESLLKIEFLRHKAHWFAFMILLIPPDMCIHTHTHTLPTSACTPSSAVLKIRDIGGAGLSSSSINESIQPNSWLIQ